MKWKKTQALIYGCFLLLFWTPPAQSCVGRILTLAITDSPDQQLIGRIVATLITERTGTTVNLKSTADTAAGEKLLGEKNADIVINYINNGLSRLDKKKAITGDQEAYGLVKQHYREKLGLIWLKPLGYRGPTTTATDPQQRSPAVVVTTRDVLERFPVLDRVINKLAGRLDNATLAALLARIKEKEEKEVAVIAKDFLKTQHLI